MGPIVDGVDDDIFLSTVLNIRGGMLVVGQLWSW